jgi:integrase
MQSVVLNTWLDNISNQNKSTAKVVKYHLADFEAFVHRDLQTTVDELTAQLKAKQKDPYDVLTGFVTFLKNTKLDKELMTERVLRYRVKAIRHFLEAHDVDISSTKFRSRVKMPRVVEEDKQGVEKDVVRKIIKACDNVRLQTYVLFLAATGWRPREVLALRWSDIDFDKDPTVVAIPGKKTKTKVGRHTFLTQELKTQLLYWKSYNYREREICRWNEKRTNYKLVQLKPVYSNEDLIFAPYHEEASELPASNRVETMYHHLFSLFNNVRKLADLSDISFYTFRRHVYTTIDGLGQNQFAEWFIGHKNSNYWAKPESEKISTFKRIEQYLTYLDVTGLEAKGADQQTKLEQVQTENMTLKKDLQDLYIRLYAAGVIKRDQ